MVKHVIILPDGMEISSGVGTVNAIRSVSFSENVNSGTELTIGSCCAAFFEAQIIAPGGAVAIQEGTELRICTEDAEGNRKQIGLFTTEKPTRSSANAYRIQTYDRMVWLDRDMTEWLDSLTAWPYVLRDFAAMVLAECGLALKNSEIPSGNFLVHKFSASGVTGRMLMQKIGEACCRFGRITSEGEFEFAWYCETDVHIKPANYIRSSLSYEDYATHPIEKVQVKQTEDDVGVIWPNSTEALNTYIISGNYLLASNSEERLLPVVQTIFEELANFTYTPCKFSTWAPSGIDVGDIIQITDINGNTFATCVMSKTRTGMRENISCVGSYRRDSVTHVNNEILESQLMGKILELKKSIEGLRVIASDLDAKVSTQVNLIADGLEVLVSQVDGISTYYRFDADGQYIGRPDDEAILRLAAGVVNVLVAGDISTTFDRFGLSALQANIRTLLMGDFVLTVSEDGDVLTLR